MRRTSIEWLTLGMLALGGAAPAIAEDGPHPFTIHDMLAMRRLSDHQVSPDGRQIVFVLRTTDLEANRGRTDLWLINADGTGLRRLTSHPDADTNPRWSPDGRSIYFLSTRSGSSQVWRISVDGGEAEQITRLPLDVANLVVSPDGRHLAFSMEVCPGKSPAETKALLDEQARRKSTGRVYDKLFVRHWDSWKDGRRSHVFVLPTRPAPKLHGGIMAAGSESTPMSDAPATGAQLQAVEPFDVMKGMDADGPTKPFGGPEEIAFTPDGRSIVFAARDEGRGEAWSTNVDLWVASIAGDSPARRLTTDNKALDNLPVFSPDGKTLAYVAMSRAGYEADRQRIMLMPWPDGKPRELAADWDRSAGSLEWSRDGKTLFVTAQNLGQTSLFAVDTATGTVKELVHDGSIDGPKVAGDRVVFSRNDLRSPADLYSVRPDGSDFRRVSRLNADTLAACKMGEPEQFSFKGWNGETVYGYVVKPVDFDPAKKYPVAFLIHGGPQGSFGNDFHYRWNPQAYAGHGYAVVMIDFHGSTGYGQAFCDAIRGDWGGKPLEDLQKGLAAALEKCPWMDGDRVAALGASYGGYMINWIAGNWPDRFRCMVCHDGNLDERIAYYNTEELWFPEWEHHGTPWENPESYEKHNPQNFVKNWKTPTLVIHGGQDFRVVETEGLATFTALQRRGIPSKLLHFPDENHWVLRPANSILWHETVLGWLDEWTKK